MANPSPPVNQFRCMKYKRKFYQADDYLPFVSTRGPDKTVSHDTNSSTSEEVNKQSNQSQTGMAVTSETSRLTISNDTNSVSILSEASSNEHLVPISEINQLYSGQGEPVMNNNNVTCRPVSPKTSENNQYSGTEHNGTTPVGTQEAILPTSTFLQTLEVPQTTQEICMTLLNMAFWRPYPQNQNPTVPVECDSNPQTDSSSEKSSPKSSSANEESTIRDNDLSSIGYPTAKRHCRERHTNGTLSRDNNMSLNGNETLYHHYMKNNMTPQMKQECVKEPLSVHGIENNLSPNDLPFILSHPAQSDRRLPRNDDGTKVVYTTLHQEPHLTQVIEATRYVHPRDNNSKPNVLQSLELHDMKYGAPTTQRNNTDAKVSTQLQSDPDISNTKAFEGHSDKGLYNDGQIMVTPQASARRHSLSEESNTSDSDSLSASSSSHGSKSSLGLSISGHQEFGGLLSSSVVKKATTLFPKPVKGRTLVEIVDIMSRRHHEDYYIGWAAEKILELPPDERPNIFPVTPQLKKELVSKSVLTENKKLSFSWFSRETWGQEFRQKLHTGVFKTLSDAKRDASHLWREYCPDYDGSRAVRMRDVEGNIVMKRTRVKSGSEFEYRQNLRKAKVNCIMDQIWTKRSVIADTLQTDKFESLLTQMQQEIPDYRIPEARVDQVADVVAFSLQQELIASSLEK